MPKTQILFFSTLEEKFLKLTKVSQPFSIFWMTFKTDKKLFQLTDPKPVLSQKLGNVTSTKYVLQLALNRFAKSPLEYEAFKGVFSI